MDLNYTAEDVAFRKQVRTWLEQNMPRHIQNLDERKAWHRRLYEGGYLGMGWPKEYGGPGRAADGAGHRRRRDGARGRARPDQQPGRRHRRPHHRGARHDAQKRRYLRKILTAEEMWCQLYSEPNAGSDLAALRTTRGQGRPLPGQRAEDLDERRRPRRLGAAARAHRSRGGQAQGHQLLPDEHAPARRGRAPAQQITGSSEFCEVFMTNARVEKENQIGAPRARVGASRRPLGYERGGRALARITTYASQYKQLMDGSATTQAERAAHPGRRGHAPEARPDLGRPRGGALRRPPHADHAGARRASRRGRLAHQALLLRVREALHGAGRGDPRRYGKLTDGVPVEYRLEVDTAVGDHGPGPTRSLVARGTIYAGFLEDPEQRHRRSASSGCRRIPGRSRRRHLDEFLVQRRSDPAPRLRPRRAGQQVQAATCAR